MLASKKKLSFIGRGKKGDFLTTRGPTMGAGPYPILYEISFGPLIGGQDTLIAELPELRKCSPQQIAALVGVAPHNHDSGNLKGYRRTKGGRKMVRSALMAVISAIRSNPKIRIFYQRLRQNGKKAKVAITACIRKFLIILNAILRNAYDDNLFPE